MNITEMTLSEFIDAGYGIKDIVLSFTVGDAIAILLSVVCFIVVSLLFLWNRW